MKVALVYDRVNKWGGAERILLNLHELFSDAPLYTAVYNHKSAPWAKVFPSVIPSFLQNFPFSRSRHELYATFMPIAFESFSFDEYDLVISLTSEAAKGIITKPSTFHICYCLTPTRYLWSAYETYFPTALSRLISKPIVVYLRAWDKIAAQRPDMMIAISETARARIKKYYGRDSKVVYPPLALGGPVALHPAPTSSTSLRALEQGPLRASPPSGSRHPPLEKDFFLIVSRLVPYKRIDIAIEAFNRLDKQLVIVGTGTEEERLKGIAGKNIQFVAELTDEELSSYYENATALIFPQEEDFGIVALEAQSFGKPVIAYKAGGATETVVEGKTGEFFRPQKPEALIKVLKKFNVKKYDSKIIKKNAERFSKEKFFREWKLILEEVFGR